MLASQGTITKFVCISYVKTAFREHKPALQEPARLAWSVRLTNGGNPGSCMFRCRCSLPGSKQPSNCSKATSRQMRGMRVTIRPLDGSLLRRPIHSTSASKRLKIAADFLISMTSTPSPSEYHILNWVSHTFRRRRMPKEWFRSAGGLHKRTIVPSAIPPGFRITMDIPVNPGETSHGELTFRRNLSKTFGFKDEASITIAGRVPSYSTITNDHSKMLLRAINDDPGHRRSSSWPRHLGETAGGSGSGVVSAKPDIGLLSLG